LYFAHVGSPSLFTPLRTLRLPHAFSTRAYVCITSDRTTRYAFVALPFIYMFTPLPRTVYRFVKTRTPASPAFTRAHSRTPVTRTRTLRLPRCAAPVPFATDRVARIIFSAIYIFGSRLSHPLPHTHFVAFTTRLSRYHYTRIYRTTFVRTLPHLNQHLVHFRVICRSHILPFPHLLDLRCTLFHLHLPPPSPLPGSFVHFFTFPFTIIIYVLDLLVTLVVRTRTPRIYVYLVLPFTYILPGRCITTAFVHTIGLPILPRTCRLFTPLFWDICGSRLHTTVAFIYRLICSLFARTRFCFVLRMVTRISPRSLRGLRYVCRCVCALRLLPHRMDRTRFAHRWIILRAAHSSDHGCLLTRVWFGIVFIARCCGIMRLHLRISCLWFCAILPHRTGAWIAASLITGYYTPAHVCTRFVALVTLLHRFITHAFHIHVVACLILRMFTTVIARVCLHHARALPYTLPRGFPLFTLSRGCHDICAVFVLSAFESIGNLDVASSSRYVVYSHCVSIPLSFLIWRSSIVDVDRSSFGDGLRTYRIYPLHLRALPLHTFTVYCYAPHILHLHTLPICARAHIYTLPSRTGGMDRAHAHTHFYTHFPRDVPSFTHTRAIAWLLPWFYIRCAAHTRLDHGSGRLPHVAVMILPGLRWIGSSPFLTVSSARFASFRCDVAFTTLPRALRLYRHTAVSHTTRTLPSRTRHARHCTFTSLPCVRSFAPLHLPAGSRFGIVYFTVLPYHIRRYAHIYTCYLFIAALPSFAFSRCASPINQFMISPPAVACLHCVYPLSPRTHRTTVAYALHRTDLPVLRTRISPHACARATRAHAHLLRDTGSSAYVARISIRAPSPRFAARCTHYGLFAHSFACSTGRTDLRTRSCTGRSSGTMVYTFPLRAFTLSGRYSPAHAHFGCLVTGDVTFCHARLRSACVVLYVVFVAHLHTHTGSHFGLHFVAVAHTRLRTRHSRTGWCDRLGCCAHTTRCTCLRFLIHLLYAFTQHFASRLPGSIVGDLCARARTIVGALRTHSRRFAHVLLAFYHL